MTHRLTANYAKDYCNRTLIVKVIVENVVTCFFLGHGVEVSMAFLFLENQRHGTYERTDRRSETLNAIS